MNSKVFAASNKRFGLFISKDKFYILSSFLKANLDEMRLYNDLINTGYNRLVRPVESNTDKLTVHFGLKLTQLLDVVCFFFFFIEIN